MAPRKRTDLLYRLLYGISWPLIRLVFRWRRRLDRDASAWEGPLIVLGNHASFVDPVFLSLSLPVRRQVRYVVGAYLMNEHLGGRMLRRLRSIPKVQFARDSTAVRGILGALREGDAVGLFPEGQRSFNGHSLGFEPGITKLIQRSGAALLTVRIDGGCIVWPRWRGMRLGSGPVATTTRFYRPEALAAEPLASLHRRLEADLAGDDYVWAEKQGRPRYRQRRRAEGLETLLHRCPSCQRDFVLEAKRDALFCGACGASSKLEASGFFAAGAPFPHPGAWHAWQLEEAQRRRLAGEHLRLDCRLISYRDEAGSAGTEELRLRERALTAHREAGRGDPAGIDGILQLERDALRFIPAEGGPDGAQALRFPIPAQGQHYYMDLDRYVVLEHGGAYYELRPRPGRNAIMIVDWTWPRAYDAVADATTAGLAKQAQ